MEKKEVLLLLARYIFLILVALPNLFLFYTVFTPLTVYPVFFILKILTGATLSYSLGVANITFSDITISLIPACIAGAAYYLLLVLNLSTPMPLKQRAKSIIFLFLSFLVLNIVRILAFTFLATFGYQYFDIAHSFSWLFGSTLLLVLIWFGNVYLFKIRAIPVYTDLKAILSDIKPAFSTNKSELTKEELNKLKQIRAKYKK